MLANIAQFCLLHIIVSLTLGYIVRFNSLRIIITCYVLYCHQSHANRYFPH